MEKKKEYWQMIRGICIIAVILIHILTKSELDYINNFNIVLRVVLNFCVGLFIFMAGYFIDIKQVTTNTKSYIIKKIKRIGVPFIIFSTIAAIISFVKNDKNIINFLIDVFLGRASEQLYYIIVLIQLIILSPVLVKIINSKNIFKNLSIIIITPIYLIVIAILQYCYKITIPQYMTIFCAWLLYYYIGIIFNVYKDKICIKITNLKLFCIWISFIIIVSILNMILLNKRIVDYSYLTSQVRIINLVYIILCILIVFKNQEKNRCNKILVELGNYSFGIYFVHTYFTHILNKLTDFNYFLKIIIGVFGVTVVSYYFIKIFKKITKNKFDKILGF